jgi:hypothetical protein
MKIPNDSQHLSIYGQTGSGKTDAGLWHLEQRSFTRRPWYIFDFKGDPTISQISRLEEIDIRHKPPKQPGLYVTRPIPDHDESAVVKFLWEIWREGKRGIFVDEAYMMGRFNKAFDTIMVQGRAIHVPVIALSQRPSWLGRFQMSETSFHQVMHIQNPRDVKTLQEWIPGLQPTQRDYHSQYYDVARGTLEYLRPVPHHDEVLDRFDHKMPRRVRLFRGLERNTISSRKRA